jgi:NAD(P)-dependent dehydrogenase (short-subunit alcohol dehydrogenase family)
VHTDVQQYESLLALFDKALALYGRVDIAISNAGIIEQPGWFNPSIDLDSVRQVPSIAVLQVNLIGTLYFAHIAAVYLRKDATPEDDKSLVLLSSVAAFEESPGLFVYQATKHGVLGLMRSLRRYFPGAYENSRIRVNCVCPWATDTAMVSTFQAAWQEEGLPMNSPEDVAQMILGVSVDEALSGESIYVEGSRGWAIERELERAKPQWLGESAAANLAKGQAFLGGGSKWSR